MDYCLRLQLFSHVVKATPYNKFQTKKNFFLLKLKNKADKEPYNTTTEILE